MTKVTMTVNGASVSGEAAGNTLLVEFLREDLRLTGTHVGCDTSQCGACNVIVDGKLVKACTMFAAEAEGDRRTRLMDTLLSGYDESDQIAAQLLRRAGYLEQRQSYCIAVARSVIPQEMENPARAQRVTVTRDRNA